MPDRNVDPKASFDHIRVLPHISEQDREIIERADTLTFQMHPLNADEQFAKIEAVLAGLSGQNTAPHKEASLTRATSRRDGMNEMGKVRQSLGMHPVPDDLQHLLSPEERAWPPGRR